MSSQQYAAKHADLCVQDQIKGARPGLGQACTGKDPFTNPEGVGALQGLTQGYAHTPLLSWFHKAVFDSRAVHVVHATKQSIQRLIETVNKAHQKPTVGQTL